MTKNIKEDPPAQELKNIKVETTTLPTVTDQPTELELIMHTIDKFGKEGAEAAVAIIRELKAMKREQEEWDAEKEFYAKLAEFQEACPQIEKTKSTGKPTDAGGKFSFMYAPLDEVERTTRPHLQPLGFSFYWDGKTTKEDGEFVREITFHLLHKNGHRTSSSISAPITKEIGSMKGLQLFGAGESYLKRYTMLAGLGIPTTDTNAEDPTLIETAIAAKIQNKVKEAGMPEKKFLKFMGVKEYIGIKRSQYQTALLAINQFVLNKPKPDPKLKSQKTTQKKTPEDIKKPDDPTQIRRRLEGLYQDCIDLKLITKEDWEIPINQAIDKGDLKLMDQQISSLTDFLDNAGESK